MKMGFPYVRCCRCFKHHPEHMHPYSFVRNVGLKQHKLTLPVPLCSDCHQHIISTRRAKLVLAFGVLIILILIAALIRFFTGSYGIPLLLIYGCVCLVGIRHFVPKIDNADFIQVDYRPYAEQLSVKFSNRDYQQMYERFQHETGHYDYRVIHKGEKDHS